MIFLDKFLFLAAMINSINYLRL